MKVKSLSHVRLFASPWTLAHQAPSSMGFSRQEYWSGCHFLLQGIFLIQGSNPGLLHCRQKLYPYVPRSHILSLILVNLFGNLCIIQITEGWLSISQYPKRKLLSGFSKSWGIGNTASRGWTFNLNLLQASVDHKRWQISVKDMGDLNEFCHFCNIISYTIKNHWEAGRVFLREVTMSRNTRGVGDHIIPTEEFWPLGHSIEYII